MSESRVSEREWNREVHQSLPHYASAAVLACALVSSCAFANDSYDREFAALPLKPSYTLVYAADPAVCKTVEASIATYAQGEPPAIYKAIPWQISEDPRFKFGPETRVATISWGGDSTGASGRIVRVVKQYFVMRMDAQVQSLTFIVDDEGAHNEIPSDLYERGPSLSGEDLYQLRALRPNQFPSGHFGSQDKRLDHFDRESTYANFYDLLKVENRLFVSFRSRNVFDMELDRSYREWFVIAALPSELRATRSNDFFQSLTDICYFVRRRKE